MKGIDEVTKQLERGVKDLFASDRYAEYLSCMGKFYNYSFNNTLLIWMQKPEATLVAGYRAWQTKFGRHVKKGENGITILAPVPHKIVKQEGDEEKEIRWNTFRATKVFDVSQTEGKDIPSICDTLTGEVDGYEEKLKALIGVSPVPVTLEDVPGEAHGFFSPKEGKIVVQIGMSEAQTLKTLIHEISHAMLHCKDGEEEKADRGTKEVQAESVAYTVCSIMGLDTSDYSFGYVAGWSSGKEVKELRESMEVIRKTAAAIVAATERRAA